MNVYQFREVRINIPRQKLIVWLKTALERERFHLAERERELKNKLANPDVSMEMIEALAANHAATSGNLASHAQQEIASLAQRVRSIREDIKTMGYILVGLQEAMDENVEVPLGVVRDLCPEDQA